MNNPAPGAPVALPSRARVVIVGGGVIGCTIAYHLATLGWRDVVLLEHNQRTSGTTWHAAGLPTTLRDTETQTRLAKHTQDLYRKLGAETGQSTGLIDCGSTHLAMTPDKAEEMRRGFHMAASFGVEAYEISPAEVKKLWPLADVSGLAVELHFPLPRRRAGRLRDVRDVRNHARRLGRARLRRPEGRRNGGVRDDGHVRAGARGPARARPRLARATKTSNARRPRGGVTTALKQKAGELQ